MQTQSLGNILKHKFIGADELRRELTAILNKLSTERGSVVITHQGKPKAVLLDIDSYIDQEELGEQIADADPKLIKHLNKIVDDVESGRSKAIPAKEVFKKLGLDHV